MPNQNKTAALEYARHLWSNILDWYKNADAKAQIVLTLSGAFLSFLTSLAFIKSDDLEKIINHFGMETWMFLGLSVLCLAGSIIASLNCLRSRFEDPEELDDHIKGIVCDIDMEQRQWPETLYFFEMIARLKDRRRFQVRMAEFTKQDEVHALSSQIFLVSRNVLKKHVWVNRGFLSIALTLVFFLASGVSYFTRASIYVKSHPTIDGKIIEQKSQSEDVNDWKYTEHSGLKTFPLIARGDK